MNSTTQNNLPSKQLLQTAAVVAENHNPPVLDDCWNRTGVAGNRSCPKLKINIHCRNCPDYSAAGAKLLDRQLPPDYHTEWTKRIARPKEIIPAERVSAVLFRIGPEWLALPAHAVQEVAELRHIHSLPHRTTRHGNLLLGLVNVRGQLLPCVSVRRLLNLPGRETTPHNQTNHHRLLVTSWNGDGLAFPVDEVHGIHRYHPHEIKPVPSTIASAGQALTRGVLSWQGKSVTCLDAESFFATLNRALS